VTRIDVITIWYVVTKWKQSYPSKLKKKAEIKDPPPESRIYSEMEIKQKSH